MGYYRRLRTNQERKSNLDGWHRAKRSPRMLPDSWDDYGRNNWGDRCWKRYRKTQYKVVDKFEKPKKSSKKFAEHMTRRDHFHMQHRLCRYKRHRCGYCWKMGFFEKADRRAERRYRELQEERERRELFFTWF